MRRYRQRAAGKPQSFNPRTHTGATSCRRSCRRWYHCFNPRTHTGATLSLAAQNHPKRQVSIHAPIRVRPSLPYRWMRTRSFQSTHPYGCDPLPCGIDTRPISFNPRTHTGATWLWFLFPASFFGFNPRTHTGATSAFDEW